MKKGIVTTLLLIAILFLGILLVVGINRDRGGKPQVMPETIETVNSLTEVVEPEPKKDEPIEKLAAKETSSQRQAVRKAESYLDFAGFSRKGLIDQLKFDGFNDEDATYAVDKIKVSWKEQAVRKAESYLDFAGFSRKGLIDQLKFDGFNDEDATYAVDKIGLR
jgi:colicin import membrane protein